MKRFSTSALVVIIASCWLHIQATNTADLADLVRQNRMAYGNLGPINAENLVRELQAALPVAEKMLNEQNTAADDSDVRTGRQISLNGLPGLSMLNPSSLLNLLLQLLIDIRTNCAYQPYNLPSIPASNPMQCASHCQAHPACTHFTHNTTSSTCYRSSSLLSLSAIISLNILPASERCHCGYLLYRSSPSTLLSLNAIIGASIL